MTRRPNLMLVLIGISSFLLLAYGATEMLRGLLAPLARGLGA